jgi:predicted SAM-dependent methyltransferase
MHLPFLFKKRPDISNVRHINLCGIGVPGYFNLDLKKSDYNIDLEQELLPFEDNSAEVVVCMSAINYFTRERGAEIIKDVFRVLTPGGIARFGVQDLKAIARKYVTEDKEFFFQKRSDGSGEDRFVGETMADKINSWFYGYAVAPGYGSKYMYDYETLALLFKKAGFKLVEQKSYVESRLPDVAQIDNRPDQMFFLEAIK